jgi:iron only hydrogenase large subunit-like protein
VAQGVTEAVKHYVGTRVPVEAVLIDGLTKKGTNQLRVFGKGRGAGNLVEVMSCEGGCICGPGVVSNPKRTVRALATVLEVVPENQSGRAGG